ncbi:MAG: GNAT family N-acetyltransferase [Fimbriimonas sp.]
MNLPQLRMHRRDLEGLPEMPILPDGYVLREATAEDADALGVVLTRSFEEPWPAQRVRDVLLDHPEVPTTFLIAHGGVPVATASYQLMPNDFPDSGWVHYVGADPNHGGKGLGYAVVLAVLHAAKGAGKRDSLLTTDDPRLAAIRTYLKLGFEPDLWHESHPERWRAVYQALGVPA